MILAEQALTPVAVHLPVEWAQKIPDVQKFNVPSLVETQIITFGQEPVSEFSHHLDEMLEQITKANSPVLFELFRQMSKGVKDMDLPSLEADIRKKLEGGWLSRIARMIGLSSQASRLESAAEEVRG